jgi:diguanylate cyclase (GGDEF)-like protein/putative nucleotidyltransferase with HDIG domain
VSALPLHTRLFLYASVGTAAVATALVVVTQMPQRWWIPFGLAPLVLTYTTYRSFKRRLAQEQLQVRQMSDVHMATLEALAVAIDARDQTCQLHIRRVQRYATALAQAFGMSGPDVEGVRTAALLHDIGKIAVPEHILSKPGPLTAEEFEKIRAHPRTGADIIASVPFPYPVSPLILNHHERWDGKGYPKGLKADEIPLGARIISAVDYFDALMTDRPYHTAMPYDAAVALVQQESGKALDPAVVARLVDMLPALIVEMEQLEDPFRRSAAGDLTVPIPAEKKNVFDDIALAHREIQALYEIAQAMGTSLNVAGTMGVIATKLSNLVPFSCAALFLYDDDTDTLRCTFARGQDEELIQRMAIPNGEGLTGWVARNRRALVNARPALDLEAAGLSGPMTLQSALVCPLVFNDRIIGVLSVYHVETSFYREDHRRLLDRVSEQAAAVIKNSMLFEQTHEESLTDALTTLPNTRYLVSHMNRELARAERLKWEVSLLVMDIDDFKNINDSYGHNVGDEALCEVADFLRSAIRPYDICVRYAGDEFIVVLPGCRLAEAEHKRQELQRGIEEVCFVTAQGKRVPLNMSIGAAVYPHDGRTYEALMAVADARMYQDKGLRKGREPLVERGTARATAGIL